MKKVILLFLVIAYSSYAGLIYDALAGGILFKNIIPFIMDMDSNMVLELDSNIEFAKRTLSLKLESSGAGYKYIDEYDGYYTGLPDVRFGYRLMKDIKLFLSGNNIANFNYTFETTYFTNAGDYLVMDEGNYYIDISGFLYAIDIGGIYNYKIKRGLNINGGVAFSYGTGSYKQDIYTISETNKSNISLTKQSIKPLIIVSYNQYQLSLLYDYNINSSDLVSDDILYIDIAYKYGTKNTGRLDFSIIYHQKRDILKYSITSSHIVVLSKDISIPFSIGYLTYDDGYYVSRIGIKAGIKVKKIAFNIGYNFTMANYNKIWIFTENAYYRERLYNTYLSIQYSF